MQSRGCHEHIIHSEYGLTFIGRGAIFLRQYTMSIVEQVRLKLDAKCSTWGCPRGTLSGEASGAQSTLYDDLHPCTEALCKFREYITSGATDAQWQELSDEVDAIHAANWPKMLARALRARVPEIPCAGLFYYRGGIHTQEKAARILEKINTELNQAVAADATIARNYFVRAEALIVELESIARGNIMPALVAFMILVTFLLIVYMLGYVCADAPKKFWPQ